MNHIDLPVWNKCNNNCVMCTNNEEMKKEHFFNYESVVEDFSEKLKGIKSLDSISLTGGETLMSPYLFKFLRYIRSRFPNIPINILTNGRLLVYDHLIKKCLSFGNINFIIPLHGHDEEAHDKITRVKGSFYQTTQGLTNLIKDRAENNEIEIRIIATRLNYRIIPKIMRFIQENFKDSDRVVLVFLEFEGEAEKKMHEVGISYRDIEDSLREVKDYITEIKEFRLYHFPLCMTEPFFWPYVWRTLPPEETVYLPECEKCVLKKYCLGLHKSYLDYEKKPEIEPRINFKGIQIKKTNKFHKPISQIKIVS